jgi:hypothetical protein
MVNVACNRSLASHYDHYHLFFVQYMKVAVIQCNVQKFSDFSLRNMNSFYIFKSYFYEINFNIILPPSLLNVLIFWSLRLFRFPLSPKVNFYK